MLLTKKVLKVEKFVVQKILFAQMKKIYINGVFFFRNINFLASTQIKRNATDLKPWKKIPGPSSLPVLGQIHHFFLPGGM